MKEHIVNGYVFYGVILNQDDYDKLSSLNSLKTKLEVENFIEEAYEEIKHLAQNIEIKYFGHDEDCYAGIGTILQKAEQNYNSLDLIETFNFLDKKSEDIREEINRFSSKVNFFKEADIYLCVTIS